MNKFYLKYGDHIVVSSSETKTNQFLAARSMVESRVKVVSENIKIDERLQSLDLSLYPNISELVFQVAPYQNYDSISQLGNMTKDDPRFSLIQRRAQAEDILNHSERLRLLGQVIRFGDRIQLYHELTSTFVNFTLDKNGYENMFVVNLTHGFSAQTHFQVNPYQNLKREGDPITYNDQFTLFCQDNYHSLGFLEAGRECFKFSRKKVEIVDFSKNLPEGESATYDTILIDELPQVSNLPTCEQQGLFKIDECFCTNLNSARGIDSQIQKINFSAGMKAFPVHYSPQEDRNNLKFGDFIRLRKPSMYSEEGFLACEDNYTGFSPEVLFRQYQNKSDYSCELHFSSIFQIIPRNIQDFGAPVTFNEANKVEIHLRHFLTSRLLHIDPDVYQKRRKRNQGEDQEDGSGGKGGNREEGNIEKISKNKIRKKRKNKKKDQKNKRSRNREYERPHLSTGFVHFAKKWLLQNSDSLAPKRKKKSSPLDPDKDQSDSEWDSNSESNEEKNALKTIAFAMEKASNKKLTQACVDAYYDRFMITISKDDSVESKKLTIEDIVQLTSQQNHGLRVSKDLNLNSSSIYDKHCTYYNPCFHKLSISIFSTNFVEIVPSKDSGAFCMEHVAISDIQKAVLFSSIMVPLIKIIDEKSFSEETIYNANTAVKELLNVMKNKEAEQGGDEVLYSDIQDAYRDLSVLDLCIKFYYYYLLFNLKNNRQFEHLLNRISYFLQKCCKDNKLNSYYLFQWNEMYIKLVLNSLWKSSKLLNQKCSIDVDKVLSAILEKKEFNSIVAKKSVPHILRTMEFENYEIKRLRLLIDIFSSNSLRDINLLRQIQAEILTSKRFSVIFRPFFEENQQFYLKVDDDDIIDLQRLNRNNIRNESQSMIMMTDPGNFPEVANISDVKGDQTKIDSLVQTYIEKTIFLAVELCKGYPTVFESRYRQFLPELLCVKMIQSEEIPIKLRAQFVIFFKEVYLESRCKDFKEATLPELLWFQSEEDKANADVHLYNHKMEILVKMYIQNRSGYALVPYMLTFLRDPSNYDQIDQKLPLLKAMLELFNFLIVRDFIDYEVVKKIKVSLFQYLKNFTSKNIFEFQEGISSDFDSEDGEKERSAYFGASVHRQSTNATQGDSGLLKEDSKKQKELERLLQMQKATLLLDCRFLFDPQELIMINLVLESLEVIQKMQINVRINDLVYQEKSLPLFQNQRVTPASVEAKINKKRIVAALEVPGSFKEDVYKTDRYLQLKKEQSTYLISEVVSERQSLRKNLFYKLGAKFEQPSSHYSYLLLEMICTLDLKVAESALRILVAQYSFRTYFMRTVPYVQLVIKNDGMERLHNNFMVVHNEIVQVMNRLGKITLQSSNKDRILPGFDSINRSLTDLVRDLVVCLKEGEGDKLKARQLYVDGLFNVPNLKELNITPIPGYFINVFNHFFLDMNNYDLKQIILKNMGFIDVVFQLLDLVFKIELGVRQSEGLSAPFFEDFVLSDACEELQRQQLVTREICIKCTTILFYCAFNNDPNQRYIKELMVDRDDNLETLFQLFTKQRSTTFSRHFFNLLTQVYGTNLTLLLKMPQHDGVLMQTLINLFAESFDEEEITPYIYYLFTQLRCFTVFKGMKIFRNNMFILEKFLKMSTSNLKKIYVFFREVLPEILEDYTPDSCSMEDGFPSLLRIVSKYKVSFVEIPIEISFAVQFLRFFSEIGEGVPDHLLDELQLMIPLDLIATLLKMPNKWYQLRCELYRYATNIFLVEDLDDTDWAIISDQMISVASKDFDEMGVSIDRSYSSDDKTFYIFDFDQYPGNSIVEGTNNGYRDLIENRRVDLIRSTICTGLVPFLRKFVDSIKLTGSSNEISYLKNVRASLDQDIAKGSRFKALFKQHQTHILNNGNITSRTNDEEQEDEERRAGKPVKGGSLNGENSMEAAFEIKLQIWRKINTKTAPFLNYNNAKKDPTFFVFGDGSNLHELSAVSYYKYTLEYPDPTAPIGQANFNYSRKFNLYEDFMGPAYYDMLAEEDRESLMMLLMGIRAESKAKFNSIMRVLLQILDYEFNSKEDKVKALNVLQGVVEVGRDFGIKIMQDLIEMDIVEILCKLLIKNYKDFSFSGHAIVMILRILQEVEDDIQDTLYRYLTENDTKNQFMQAVVLYMESSFQGLLSSESLREEVVASLSGEEDLEKDKVLVERESLRYMLQTQNCLQMLRLMCENHYDKMQNFLREQINTSGFTRHNSINVLLKVSKILKSLVPKIDPFNAPIFETIFDFFIETLQGPCANNQRQICNSILMETAEDLLINLSRVSQAAIAAQSLDKDSDNMSSLRSSGFCASSAGNQAMSSMGLKVTFLRNQYILSSLISKITTFMTAVIEATSDKQVVAKISVHIQIDIMLERLRSIYVLFKKDIQKDQFKKLMNNSRRITGLQRKRKNKQFQEIGGVDEVVDEDLQKEWDGMKPLKVLVDRDKEKDREYNPIVMEGLQIWILMKMVADLDPDFASSMTSSLEEFKESSSSSARIVKFFESKVSSIEIINMLDNLQTIFFPIHPVTKYLSDYSKVKFGDEVPRDIASDKLRYLLENFPDFYREMMHFQSLNTNGVKVNLTYFSYLKWIALTLVIFANILQLASDPGPLHGYSLELGDVIIQTCVFMIMGIYIIIFVLWLVFNARLDFEKILFSMKDQFEEACKIERTLIRGQTRFSLTIQFVVSYFTISYLLDLSLNLLFAFLTIFVSRIFISLMLLDIVFRFELLKNVVRAIGYNTKQMFMTSLLGLAILNIYAAIGYFTSVSNDFIFIEAPDYVLCNSHFLCFLSIMGFGLRSGGGIGDVLRYPDYRTEIGPYMAAFVFDFTFFVVVILIFFNIVSGFIIDTFGDLREKKTRDDFDRNMICFICNISKTVFVKNGINFKQHRNSQHNEWDYINFLAHIQEVDENDLNGLESFIYDKMDSEDGVVDISWIPIGQAVILKLNETGETSSLEDYFFKFLERVKEKARKLLGEEIDNQEIIKFVDKLEIQ